MLSRKTFTYILLISFFSLQGCLGTTQHFKTSHLLKSGDYSYTYGYSPGTAYQCAGDAARDSDNNSYCPATLKKVPIHSFSRSFRLGVRDQWGPLPGVEIGYQIEIPNTLEFDLTLGLPHPFTLKFAHATSIGWSLGLWPDNTYFVDYSAGYQTNNFTFFTSIRNAWQATQAYDLELSSEEKDTSTGSELFHHNRKWVGQITFGIEWKLQEIPVVPDRIHFQTMLQTPVLGFYSASDLGSDSPKYQNHIIGGVSWDY